MQMQRDNQGECVYVLSVYMCMTGVMAISASVPVSGMLVPQIFISLFGFKPFHYAPARKKELTC